MSNVLATQRVLHVDTFMPQRGVAIGNSSTSAVAIRAQVLKHPLCRQHVGHSVLDTTSLAMCVY